MPIVVEIVPSCDRSEWTSIAEMNSRSVSPRKRSHSTFTGKGENEGRARVGDGRSSPTSSTEMDGTDSYKPIAMDMDVDGHGDGDTKGDHNPISKSSSLETTLETASVPSSPLSPPPPLSPINDNNQVKRLKTGVHDLHLSSDHLILQNDDHEKDEKEPQTSPKKPRNGAATPEKRTASASRRKAVDEEKQAAKKTLEEEKQAAKKKAEEAKQAAKKKLEDEKQAAKKKADEEKLAAKKKAEEARLAAKAKADAEKAEREAKKAARQQERDEIRRKKEEEDRKKEEEREKKERSQLRLNSFFKLPATASANSNTLTLSPKKKNTTASTATHPSPSKASPLASSTLVSTTSHSTSTSSHTESVPVQSEYTKRFKPFFIKEHVRLSQPRWPMDEETREAKTKILSEFIHGQRQRQETSDSRFNAVETFHLPSPPPPRGYLHNPLRQTMDVLQQASESNDKVALARAQEALARVPMKFLRFPWDVRPPYYGTLTDRPHQLGLQGLRQIARRPCKRWLDVDYDYDSEQEWLDDEAGDDVDDLDDEDEDLMDEDGDDMAGFLDDEDDAALSGTASRRAFVQDTIEPDSTGLIFEEADGQSPLPLLQHHRMEFLLYDGPYSMHQSIDPFSTAYWQDTSKPNGTMGPPPNPTGSMTTLRETAAISGSNSSETGATTAAANASAIKRMDLVPDVIKVIIENDMLSKLGLVDVISHRVSGITKIDARAILDLVAEKRGPGRIKKWEVRPEYVS